MGVVRASGRIDLSALRLGVFGGLSGLDSHTPKSASLDAPKLGGKLLRGSPASPRGAGMGEVEA